MSRCVTLKHLTDDSWLTEWQAQQWQMTVHLSALYKLGNACAQLILLLHKAKWIKWINECKGQQIFKWILHQNGSEILPQLCTTASKFKAHFPWCSVSQLYAYCRQQYVCYKGICSTYYKQKAKVSYSEHTLRIPAIRPHLLVRQYLRLITE